MQTIEGPLFFERYKIQNLKSKDKEKEDKTAKRHEFRYEIRINFSQR